MNSAIMMTFALTTICCFANSVVADCNVQDPGEIKVSEVKILFDRVNAMQNEWNTTIKDELTKRQSKLDSWISLANSNISAYATTAGKSGTKAYEICQSDYDDYVKNYKGPRPVNRFDFCISWESQRIENVLNGIRILIGVLEPSLNDTSTKSDIYQKNPVCSYDNLKTEFEENMIGTDASKPSLIQEAIQCLNNLQGNIEKNIKHGEKCTKSCIDSDGTKRGFRVGPFAQ